ncbi:hypothetical protein HMPREF3038_02788 [Akkermansia sp. KLE1797]|nr:hypothetical protein HMPREF3038_02788 [Akkermansia sp. KLE1797]KXU53111.1 hypothetical protein HMPREF3039_02667 [Akkermansia sp. KLE1798]KZA03750.1 hypothetical protein HMPREF1326_02523 [Akkermansia sp. KLE1605]
MTRNSARKLPERPTGKNETGEIIDFTNFPISSFVSAAGSSFSSISVVKGY